VGLAILLSESERILALELDVYGRTSRQNAEFARSRSPVLLSGGAIKTQACEAGLFLRTERQLALSPN